MAQDILRNTLGMELVELRSRAELDKDATAAAGNGKEDDLDEARKATGVKKKCTSSRPVTKTRLMADATGSCGRGFQNLHSALDPKRASHRRGRAHA
jgi:hypothetical protein